MSSESKERVKEKSLVLQEAMDLAELRSAMKLSQQEIASSLKIGQASVAKLEKRADMYVSTLRRFIEAIGGELDIIARFPDHSVCIKTFSQLSGNEAKESDQIRATPRKTACSDTTSVK